MVEPEFDDDEPDDRGRADQPGGDRLRCQPSVLRPGRQGVDQQRHAGRRQQQAAQVEPAGRSMELLAEPQRREHQCDRADRQVDIEDPAPRGVVDEHATEHRPDRRGDHGDAEDAHGGRRPLGQRERSKQHRAADRGDQPGAEPLEDPEHDEQRQARCRAAEARCDHEHRQGHDEHSLGPEPIAEPAGRRNDGGEGEQVGDRDPLDVGRRHVELAGERRQCDVHDGAVDDRHEQPDDVHHHHSVLVLHAAEPTRRVGIMCR